MLFRFRQCQREYAVFIRGRNFVAVDTVDSKCSCEGTIGTFSSNIVVFFTIFFIVSFAFRVDSKVSVSDFGVDILFGEAGELSV